MPVANDRHPINSKFAKINRKNQEYLGIILKYNLIKELKRAVSVISQSGPLPVPQFPLRAL